MTPFRLLLGWLVATTLLVVQPLAAQGPEPLRVEVGEPGAGWRPVLEVGPLLDDPALRDALGSGLPLRFNLRVELWQRGLFDRLVQAQEVFLAMVRDPLTRELTLDDGRAERRFASLADAQAAIRGSLRAGALRPQERGRYYYLARLEVETLSLSDLDELRHWLRGEVRPAVEGGSSAGRALERGLRRVLIRIIGLPTRSFEARSRTFVLE